MTIGTRPRLTSIPAGHYARLLAAALPKDHTVGCVSDEHPKPITLEARRCSVFARGSGWKRGIRLSGGLALTVRTSSPAYGVPWSTAMRLRPGWSNESFERAAAHLYELARRQRDLDARRDLVYAKFGDAAPEAIVAAAEADAARDGRPVEYGAMSHEDCDYWLAWKPTARS